MRRLIIFLVRWRLGLKKYQYFRFTNQKTDAVYYFTIERLIKYENHRHFFSSVSLNWLLSDECEIEKLDRGTRYKTYHKYREEKGKQNA